MIELIMATHDALLTMSKGLNAVSYSSRKVIGSIVYVVFVARAEMYDGLNDQVTDLMIRIARDHGFPDGNKRTAVISGLTIIDMVRGPLKISDDDVVKAAMLAAAGDRDSLLSIVERA
jgi:prophage maintenance system killer protein